MGLSAKRPNTAATTSTAFVARRVHTIAVGGPGKRTLWQRMGLESTTLSLPVFQYHPEDKACSVWLYETDKCVAPHQKLTWFGVKSLADGQNVLAGTTVSSLFSSCRCVDAMHCLAPSLTAYLAMTAAIIAECSHFCAWQRCRLQHLTQLPPVMLDTAGTCNTGT